MFGLFAVKATAIRTHRLKMFTVKRRSRSPLAAHVAVLAQHDLYFLPVEEGAVSYSIAIEYATLRPLHDGLWRNAEGGGHLCGAGISDGSIIAVHI